MKNELTVFNNPEFGKIRTMIIDDEVWFVGKDIAEALGYSDTKSALADHVDAEDKQIIQRGQIATLDIPNRGLTIINESGVYSLGLSSKLPGAKRFRHWVTSEVLPSIRKTGKYQANSDKEERAKNAAKRLHIMELNAKSRAVSQMQRLWNAAGIQPQYQALTLNGYLDGLRLPQEAFSGVCTHMLDATTIAKNLNIYSKSGKPHAQLVGAVISTLELLPGESAETPYSRNGHDGVSTQYATSVQTKVWQWFEAAHWPVALDIKGRHYNIVYTEPGAVSTVFHDDF